MRRKIEKTIEIAIDAAKKLAEVYGNPEKLVHVGLMKINHAKDALSILEFLNPEKHPLDVIGDHIIELKKMHPEVVKPEKVYGEEWYEFLKKKGIDPSELTPEKKKSKPSKSQTLALTARELLGMLKGLKLTGYSETALENAKAELWKRIDELMQNPTDENLKLAGVYAFAIRLIERKEFKKAEELFGNL